MFMAVYTYCVWQILYLMQGYGTVIMIHTKVRVYLHTFTARIMEIERRNVIYFSDVQ